MERIETLLIDELREGDMAALAILVEKYKRLVYRVAVQIEKYKRLVYRVAVQIYKKP